MRTKAFSLLRNLSLEFCEPEKALKAMRVFLEKVLTHTRATCTKNMIERFIAQNTALNDVEALALNVFNKMKNENLRNTSFRNIAQKMFLQFTIAIV